VRNDYLEIAKKILKDAYLDKHYTVPEDAIIDFNNEMVNHFKILNNRSNMYDLIFFSKPGDFSEVTSHSFWVMVSKSEPIFVSEMAFPTHIRDWFFLISACIVRDFVVANMVSYEKRVQKKYMRVGTGKDRKRIKEKKVIYLPRKKFFFDEYISAKDFQSKVRVQIAPHIVRGHLRNLPEGWKASETANQRALEFGFILKEGQTFVSPHKRGEIEQLRTYRGRSALQVMFAQRGK